MLTTEKQSDSSDGLSSILDICVFVHGRVYYRTLNPQEYLTTVVNDAQDTCPEVMQEILKDGFHRDLLVRVNLGIADEALRNCTVAIKVNLPKGLYVDPYELTSLQEHNITKALVIANNLDLEVPEYLATDISVLVYTRPDPECFSCFQALLPLHCRYHRPVQSKGKISVVLEDPEVLISCQKSFLSVECLKQTDMEAPCSQKSLKMCHWDKVKFKAINEGLKLEIPVGFSSHLTLVCMVTLLATLLCSSIVLSALFKHGDFSFVQSSW